jgi:hypothetical protein
MIENNHLTSLLVSSQLPEFVRDDPNYQNFSLFLKAYYEWLEQEKQVTNRTKNIPSYMDIDNTLDEFIDYYYNEFLNYFPKDILADKTKVAKIAKELYQSKGTPASYEFLFRVLYDSPVDFFFTKDAVLKASDGVWYVSKALNLATADLNFLDIKQYQVFGETSKAIATIENSIFDGKKIVIYISNIQRSFQSGEIIRIIDSNNQLVTVNNVGLRSKIVGQVNEVRINNNNRGLLYKAGDPVVISGGLNSPTGLSASAVIGAVTKGSLQNIRVLNGGYGYQISPNTVINISGTSGAAAEISGMDPNPRRTSNIALVPINTIMNQASIKLNANNYNFSANARANLSCSLANAFSYLTLTAYPISAVILNNAGSGLEEAPTIAAESYYATDNAAVIGNIRSLGILAPIQVTNAGVNYHANDRIIFTGGSGSGANAIVNTVNANGSITSIQFVPFNPAFNFTPLGGSGYRATGLPTVAVQSSTGSNASIYVPGICGDGAEFVTTVDRIGSISYVTVTDPGADYISVPDVSLKVQDLAVANVSITNLPQKGDLVYQGTNLESATYFATVDSITPLYPLPNPTNSVFTLRVFNYNQKPNASLPLKIDSRGISYNLTNQYNTYNPASRYDSTGVLNYGDGTAKANAIFTNGLVSGEGKYIGTRGQLSSFDVLQNEEYNNYTYVITLEKEIEKYRNIVNNLLHPTGTKMLGRYVLNDANTLNFAADSAAKFGHTLAYYTGNPASSATITSDFNNASNNIIKFYGLSGANLENIIFPNSTIRLTTSNNITFQTEVLSVVDGSSNTIIAKDNVWLTFANVAYVTANAGSNVINITTLTGSYDIINNGEYSDDNSHLKDIVFAGDNVLVANNTQRQVTRVDYAAGKIYVNPVLANAVNSLISVNRTFTTSNIQIFGPLGTQYFTEITDELGNSLITENGSLILLG